MQILVLGATGMLGYEVAKNCAQSHEVYAVGHVSSSPEWFSWLDASRIVFGIDASRIEEIRRLIIEIKPQVVINAIGVVKQDPLATEPLTAISLNSLFPHHLQKICEEIQARFIHFSTDCVFSGKKGSYLEKDAPDPLDLYGRSKLLGEVVRGNSLTIRTSFIGRQLQRRNSLLEWFLNTPQKVVEGYRRAIFSGFTTPALGRLTATICSAHPQLKGLYHLSSQPIDKYSLLMKLKRHYRRDIAIIADEEFRCDRSLDSSRFQKATGIKLPSWDEMIGELPVDSRELTARGL